MKRELSFKEAFISCLTCDVNYSAQDNSPTFCQDGVAIDPRDVIGNMDRARDCSRWFPLKRRVAGPEYPDNERWYEKDSMG